MKVPAKDICIGDWEKSPPFSKELEASTAASRRKFEENRQAEVWQAQLEEACELGLPPRAISLLGIAGPVIKLKRTTALQAVHRYNEDVLILQGDVGTGKTIAATRWAWSRKAFFVKVFDMCRLDEFSDEGRALLDRALHSKYLVLDDLGSERPDIRGFWAARLDMILDARYDVGEYGGTVITTNLSLPLLRDHVGARAWDRLCESARIIPCVGPSLRVPRAS